MHRQRKRSLPRTSLHNARIVSIAFVLALTVAADGPSPDVNIEENIQITFQISQNSELISFSDFGDPPQCALWLEDPEDGSVYFTTSEGKFKVSSCVSFEVPYMTWLLTSEEIPRHWGDGWQLSLVR